MTLGDVKYSFVPPAPSPGGVAFDGKYLWIVRNFVGNNLWQVTTSGEIIRTFALGFQPGGITYDGKYFWISDIINTLIYMADTDGNLLRSFATPMTNPYDLAFDGDFLWVIGEVVDMLAQMDREGNIINTFPIPWTTSPNSIAFLGKDMFHSDYSPPQEVHIIDRQARVLQSQVTGITYGGACFDGKDIWAADTANTLISKLSLI